MSRVKFDRIKVMEVTKGREGGEEKGNQNYYMSTCYIQNVIV